MNEQQTTKISRFLSLVLRHQPETAGIQLDGAGWVPVEKLLSGCKHAGRAMTRAELDHVVHTNAKRRFEFNEDGLRILASQGHSVEVDLGHTPAEPPDALFHGTVAGALTAIRAEGLRPMARHHVHLSRDEATARQVGARRGAPVVLRVDARGMRQADHEFLCTPNGVWLVAHVPPAFITDYS